MKDSKFVSFKEQMRKVLILYSLIPIIFLSFVGYGLIYFFEFGAIRKDNQYNSQVMTRNLDNVVREYFNEVENLYNDKVIIDAMLNKKANKDAYEKIYKSINSTTLRGNFIVYDEDLHVLMNNAQFIGSDNGYSWGFFMRMQDNINNTIIYINKLHFKNNSISVFSVGRAVKKHGRLIGYIVFNILNEDLREFVGEGSSYNTIITDKTNNIAFTTNDIFKDKFGKVVKKLRADDHYVSINKERFYVTKSPIYYSNLILYTISRMNHLTDSFVNGVVYLCIVFIIIMVAMHKAAKVIASKKTAAVEKIVEAIENIKTGDLSSTLYVETNDEFRIIADSYNKMLENIKFLIEQNKEEVKHGVLLEIKQLESQFNPHFLFNTLEMLKYTIKTDTSMANKIILNISSLLRFSIENKSSEVTLERELQYAENYLDIQRFRFGENFDYHIDVDKETRNFLVPKLVLQPIIENSIKHGYTQINKLMIFIKTKKQKDKLVITIYDNGNGIEKEKLHELRKRLKDRELNIGNHIGIYNVHRRIQLIYGDNYGIKVQSSERWGTIVKLVFSIKTEG